MENFLLNSLQTLNYEVTEIIPLPCIEKPEVSRASKVPRIENFSANTCPTCWEQGQDGSCRPKRENFEVFCDATNFGLRVDECVLGKFRFDNAPASANFTCPGKRLKICPEIYNFDFITSMIGKLDSKQPITAVYNDGQYALTTEMDKCGTTAEFTKNQDFVTFSNCLHIAPRLD